MSEKSDISVLPPERGFAQNLMVSAFPQADSPTLQPVKLGKSDLLPKLDLDSEQLKGTIDSSPNEWKEHATTAALAIAGFLIARSAFKNISMSAATKLEREMLKPGLALELRGANASLEARTASDFLKRPLPRFDQITSNPAYELRMSASALKQSQNYVETGLISSRLENGTRLPVITDSRGFTSAGIAKDQSEKFIVVDRDNDRILQSVIDDAKVRYAGRSLLPETAEDLRTYVGSLMNRHNLPGESLEQLYEEMLRRSESKLIPLGLFISKGSGPCLPRSALYKTIADEIGMQARLREGFLGIKKPQPHVWTEVQFGPKYGIYDASHPANPLFRYLSTKH